MFDALDRELPTEKVVLELDESNETYEARITIKEGAKYRTRIASVVGIETPEITSHH